MILVLGSRVSPAKPVEAVLQTTAEKTEEPEDKNLTNEDPGLDSKIEAALPELDRLAEQTVDNAVTMDNIGQPTAADNDQTALQLPGLNPMEFTTAGVVGDTGAFLKGDGGERGSVFATFPGRSGATKSKLIKEGGGNEASERAVALGLAWLAKQQKQDGGWTFEQ